MVTTERKPVGTEERPELELEKVWEEVEALLAARVQPEPPPVRIPVHRPAAPAARVRFALD